MSGGRPFRLREYLPSLVRAPADPITTSPIVITHATTGRSFALQVLANARRYTVPAAVLVVIQQIGEALVPVLMALAIERAVTTGDLGQLLLWVVLLAVNFTVLSFSWRYGSRMGELGLLAVQHQLRNTITEHLLRPAPSEGSPGTHAQRAASQPGLALSLATSDVNRLSGAVAIGVYPVAEFSAVVFGGAVLLTISWPLGLAVLIGAPIVLWSADRAGSALRRRSGDEQAEAANAADEAADLMAGYRVIRGIGAEGEASVRYRRASRAALRSTLHARRAEGVFRGSMELITGLFVTAIAIAAGLSALGGAIGLGELIAIVGLTQFLIAPLENFATNAGTVWAAATASADRLLALLREDDESPAPRGMPSGEGTRSRSSRRPDPVDRSGRDCGCRNRRPPR